MFPVLEFLLILILLALVFGGCACTPSRGRGQGYQPTKLYEGYQPTVAGPKIPPRGGSSVTCG